MNTSVNIGSSQAFRLSRALLMYGTRPRPRFKEDERQAVPPACVAVQSTGKSPLGACPGSKHTAESGQPNVHGPILELLRQWRCVHGKHEDSPRENSSGDRCLGELIFRERVYPCLRGSQAYAFPRRSLGVVAVPRRETTIPDEVPGEIA